MKTCIRCHRSPVVAGTSYCRPCNNARQRERYAACKTGDIKPTLCKCGKADRLPGQSYCRDCKREYDMWRCRKQNKTRPENYRGHWEPAPKLREGLVYCRGCGRALSPDQFYKDSHRKTGRMTRCKLCQRFTRQQWAKRRAAHIRAKKREYYAANTARVLERNRLQRLRRKKEKLTRVYKEKL